MNFEIEVNGRSRTVKIERTGSRYRIESDGRLDVVDVARVDRTTISMILLGERETSHEATLLEGREPGEVEVYLRSGVVRTLMAGAPGQRRWSAAGSVLGGPGGPQRITAPMPGKIVKVLVKPGDHVTARQGVVVIEAMKMENELRASRDGQVKDIHVAEGDLVDAGRLLAVIE
jgi:biotin carboxyl carrier protein